jgi:hypothetical protein
MCNECAKKVTEILDEMERNGEFSNLSQEEKEYERMALGLRIRSNVPCPERTGVRL